MVLVLQDKNLGASENSRCVQLKTRGKYIANLEIEVPQEIMLSIICNDGLYKTKAQLRRLENEEPYAFWFVQTPQGLEYQQNREYFRIIADYECIYSLKNGDNLKEIFTKTINIR